MSASPNWNLMFVKANEVRLRAHAPYSRFLVGAALWCNDGSTEIGCNVENSSFGLTLCAERNAVAAAVAQGKRPVAAAIVVDAANPVPPCGACRQVLMEFGAPEFEVRSYLPDGRFQAYTLQDLLPYAFRGEELQRPT